MKLAFNLPDSAREVRPEEWVDLEGRALKRLANGAKPSLVAFPLAFFCLAMIDRSPFTEGPWFRAAFALTLVATTARWLLLRRVDAALSTAERVAWRRHFHLTFLLNILGWTSIVSAAIYTRGFDQLSFIGLLASTTMVSLAIVVYAADFALLVTYILAISLPQIVALLLHGSSATIGLGLAIGVLVLLCLDFSHKAHVRLWQGLINNLLLERKTLELEQLHASQVAAGKDLESKVLERTREYEKVLDELRQRERDYKQIFDQAHDAILIFEPETERVLEINHRACEIYGFTRAEMIGMSLASISKNPHLGRRRILDTLQQGTFLNFETVQRRKDQTEITLEINAAVIEFQGRQAILSINRDVTERKRLESLRLAKEAAERANQAKSQFLANMSHEVRTPMAGIIGLANLLAKSAMPPKERHYLETLRASAESLLELLDDVLDFSKVEAGKLLLVEDVFDLRALVDRIIELLQPRAAAQGVQLEVVFQGGIPDLVSGAPSRLRQVLLNLLGNAVKFTSNGEVVLTVSAEAGPLETVRDFRFHVHDTGIGIPLESQAGLFEPFHQVEGAANRRFGGTGLGLAISRRLVELMGGTIGFDSQVGVGSNFYFTVPLQPASRAAGAPLATQTGQSVSGHILVAEDNPVNQMVVLAQLERLGLVADAVANGQEVLAALDHRSYDLVLMDCQMPVMDGYEATRRIRQREAGGIRHLPVVALTAHAMVGDEEKCLAAGMDAYLAKPFTEDRLVATLRRYLVVGPDCFEASSPPEELLAAEAPPAASEPSS